MSKLLEEVRDLIRTLHEQSHRRGFLNWIRQYTYFTASGTRRGQAESSEFLTHLAVKREVAVLNSDQALAALSVSIERNVLKKVLKQELPWLKNVERARRRRAGIPLVLTRAEVSVCTHSFGATQLVTASLLYGAGPRLVNV